MFRLYRVEARSREQYGVLTGFAPVDSRDAAQIAKAVTALPEQHRLAINWHYVKPIGPLRMARALGVTREGLAHLVRDGRQMLINRGY